MIIGVEVEFTGELPFRLKVPKEASLSFESSEWKVNRLEVKAFQVPRPPEQGSGYGIDDGMGNYVRSRIYLNFTTKTDYDESTNQIHAKDLHTKVLEIVNTFIDGYRYVALDPQTEPVTGFSGTARYEVYKVPTSGNVSELLCEYPEVDTWPLPSPFGLALVSSLTANEIDVLSQVLNTQRLLNPAWLLWVDAKRAAHFANVNRCILNLAIALEIHVENVVEQYRAKLPSTINPDDIYNMGIYSLYDEGLKKLVGISLHSQPDLFKALEYIRVLRNSIAHRWLAIFRVSELAKSKYLVDHKRMDGHQVTSAEELLQLVDRTQEILEFVDSQFVTWYS